MFKIFKNLISGKDKKEPEIKESLMDKMHQKSIDFTSFVKEKINETKNEFGDVKYKMSNLLETNYNLGLKHIEKGNIGEAVFRFRFIKLFWPKCHDAHYQLAYSLMLKNRPFAAKKILQNLIIIDPQYQEKAQDLINKINDKIANVS